MKALLHIQHWRDARYIKYAGFTKIPTSLSDTTMRDMFMLRTIELFGATVTLIALVVLGHTYYVTGSLAATLHTHQPRIKPVLAPDRHPHAIYADLTIKLSHCLSALKPFAGAVEQVAVDSDCKGTITQADWERAAQLYAQLNKEFPHQ